MKSTHKTQFLTTLVLQSEENKNCPKRNSYKMRVCPEKDTNAMEMKKNRREFRDIVELDLTTGKPTSGMSTP